MVVCLLAVMGLGTGLFLYVYKMSKQYGEHGLMKKRAVKYIPKSIKNK